MNEPEKQDEQSLPLSPVQTVFAWVGTLEMLARRVWELEQHLEVLSDAHTALVSYVERLEVCIEYLEQEGREDHHG